MTEWVSWLDFMIIVPSVSNKKFFGVVADFVGVVLSIHDSWELILGHKLIVFNHWHSHWEFSTWVNVSSKNVEDSLRKLLSSKKGLDLSIDKWGPVQHSSSRSRDDDDGFGTSFFVVNT